MVSVGGGGGGGSLSVGNCDCLRNRDLSVVREIICCGGGYVPSVTIFHYFVSV